MQSALNESTKSWQINLYILICLKQLQIEASHARYQYQQVSTTTTRQNQQAYIFIATCWLSQYFIVSSIIVITTTTTLTATETIIAAVTIRKSLMKEFPVHDWRPRRRRSHCCGFYSHFRPKAQKQKLALQKTMSQNYYDSSGQIIIKKL